VQGESGIQLSVEAAQPGGFLSEGYVAREEVCQPKVANVTAHLIVVEADPGVIVRPSAIYSPAPRTDVVVRPVLLKEEETAAAVTGVVVPIA
jgi:hypothetical protein